MPFRAPSMISPGVLRKLGRIVQPVTIPVHHIAVGYWSAVKVARRGVPAIADEVELLLTIIHHHPARIPTNQRPCSVRIHILPALIPDRILLDEPPHPGV